MINKCTYKPKIKAVYLVKKGMAEKAFKNNLVTGNTDKIKKQIKKGTVKMLGSL